MKKFLIAASALLATVTLSVGAAGFSSTATYKDGMFSDVKSDQWYATSVKSAYELGFMNGVDDGVFSPDGQVSVAQAVTIAARVNAIYNGKAAPTNSTSGNWYDTYVKYALDNGIIADGQFDDYNRAAERFEVAEIFAKTVPESYYNAVNNVKKVPDVPKTNAYAKDLLMLYNAGIIMGNDDYGTFFPTSNIKRSEISAIINRVAIPENRLHGELVNADYEDAYYLIDDVQGITTSSSVNIRDSSWNYDNRNRMKSISNMPGTFSDFTNELPVTVWKDIDNQSEGLLSAEMNFTYNGSGIYFAFTDDNKNDLAKLEIKGGKFLFNGVDTGFEGYTATVVSRLDMDLDTRKATLYFRGKPYGTYDLPAGVEAGRFYASTTKEDKSCGFGISRLSVYRNYLVNDRFVSTPQGQTPEAWEITGDMVTAFHQCAGYDSLSVDIAGKKGINSVAKQSFNKISGNIIFETYVLLPEMVNGAKVSLNSGNTSIASYNINGDTITNGKGDKLRFHNNNMWQTLRMEANTTTGKVKYYVNGKDCGTFALDNTASFADNVTISFNPDKDATMSFDDVFVSLSHEYDDYCPEPQAVTSDKYDVVLNVCSLWRQGTHSGWEAVSAYPDKETYLGFYDEGLTEVADWEIKFMVEHGIEVQHLCWYCPSSDIKDPIKDSRLNFALHDGYFYSKYSDMMKFTFMWENSGVNCTSLETFKDYIWSYWVDYYFSDPRFYTVDNKVVFTVWSYGNFSKAFGGAEGARAAKAFMDEDIKKYGYDGVILLFADGHNQSAGAFKNMAALGGDGAYGYHWQQDGIYASTAMPRMQKNEDFREIHIVPTASVGFNNIGWATGRKPMASVEEHKKQLEYIRDTYLPSQANEEDWHSKMLIISTWNEYGEGTYVMPSGVTGFGYLDNIRTVLYGDTDLSKIDVKPTEQQKARLGHLYTGDKTSLFTTDYVHETDDRIPEEKAVDLDFSKWDKMFGVDEFVNDKGEMTVTSKATDFAVTYKGDLGFNASDVEVIHIRTKVEVTSALEIFFQTDAEPSWTQPKSFSITVEPSEDYKDYYIDVSKNSLWAGKITQIRLDPANKPQTCKISAVEMLKYSVAQANYTVTIDDAVYSPCKRITSDGDELYTVAEPYAGFFSLLNYYYEWSRYTNKLYILSKNGTEITFNIGSDVAIVNGKEEKLAKKVELYDGLPVLPLKWLLGKTGLTNYTIKDKVLELHTIDSKYNDILATRVANQWEFNIPGDAEGWAPSFMSYEVTDDGIFVGTASERPGQSPLYDSMMSMTTNMSAKNYYKLVIRVKCDLPEGADKTNFSVYFSTDTESGLDQKKNVGIDLTAADGKDYKEYTLDFSENEKWTGTIKSLRVDPLGAAGTIYIDYMRFIYDPAGKKDAAVYNDEKFEIFNGDAEDTKSKAFYSGNANVTIVEDKDKKDNHVINVEAKAGNNWTYVRQKVTYTPGATYTVEFDAKLIGTALGETDIKTKIHVNAVYADGEKSDHIITGRDTSPSEGWVHMTCTYTVPTTSNLRDKDEFAIYTNPFEAQGVSYQIDNVVVTEKLPD